MVTNFLKNAFQFIIPPEKRINRSRYLAILVLCGVLTYIRELYIPLFQPSKLSYVAAATLLAYIVITIIAIIKRAHDINLSGAWGALYSLVVMAIAVLPEISDSYNYLNNKLFFSVYCIITLIIDSLLLIIPGTKGANKFGEQPPKSSALVRFIAAIALLFCILSLFLIAIGLYYDYLTSRLF